MQLGRFELMGKIGEGAHGVVWLANDPKLEREVAIKVLQPDMAADAGVQHRFRREMKSIARLRHPNIIELIDFSDPDAEWPYLVMERLLGETLLQLVSRRGPLPPVAAASAGHEICLALEHAHAQGIIHRDLKPENIFAEPSGRIVLCDFGIAVGFMKNEGETLSGKNTKLLGSPLYMSPEQILPDIPIGPPSDLFALGSVLYFLVTGRHAFSEETVLGVLKRITGGEANPLPAELADSRLARIMAKLLSPRPEDRYASAEIVSEELLRVLQEAGHADARRALKQSFSGMVRPVQLATAVTSIADLDKTSQTLIAKVVQGKVQWADLTASGLTTGTQTSIVDLSSLRDRTHSGSTQIATPIALGLGTQTANLGDEESSARPWLLALIALVFIAASASAAWFYTRHGSSQKPRVIEAPTAVEQAPLGIPMPKPEAVPQVPKPIEEAPLQQPPAVKPQPKPVASKPGTLRIIAKPWAYVQVDGLQVGQTPAFREIELAPGKHRLRLANPDLKTVSRDVEIRSGEETKIKIDLESP